jgi:hypothetical protein
MMLTDYRVKGVGADMTEAAFLAVLRGAGSSVGDGEARAVYSYCLARQVSPAWLLAVFRHESGMGKAGTATETHSWGNTREPSFGVPSLGTVPGRSGVFTRYANWADGGVSTVARICDHKPYAGKETVRAITPVWAPPTDLNDTEGYIAAVLADIERWAQPQEQPGMALADRVDILPPGKNRPQTKLRGFTAVVIHETDNEDPGANAKSHRRWLERDRPDASFTFCVDADESLQILPDDEVCWAIGDGADEPTIDDSFTTLSIEICVNDRARFASACRRAAKVAAAVLAKKGAAPSITAVRQHGSYWSTRNPKVHKGCPKHLQAGDWGVSWAGFVKMVDEEFERISHAQPQPAPTGAVITPAIDWDGDGEIIHSYEEVIARNAKGQVYIRSRHDGTMTPWQELTKGA